MPPLAIAVPDEIRVFLDSELGYIVLLFALFVIPRLLLRWRLPTAITSFVLGAVAGAGFGLYGQSATLHLLAIFGIVCLFLFAGLDVDVRDFQKRAFPLGQHLVIMTLLLLGAAWLLIRYAGLAPQPAALVALAVLTPSTGFILDSLDSLGLDEGERFWVKSKAIAAELLALAVLFFTRQSANMERLVLATLALAGIVAVLPPIFRFFAQRIAPYAPKSEFAFMVMMGLVAAFATRALGVYYLVGAFLVGIAARRFRDTLPAAASERLLNAVEVFASFFAPFYFFAAGAGVRRAELTPWAIAIGVGAALVLLPLRTLSVSLPRRWALGERWKQSRRVAIPMLPTLVFSLVLVDLLREGGATGAIPAVPAVVLGGIVVYAVLSTITPGFFFGVPPMVFDAPELPPRPSLPPPPAQDVRDLA